MSCQKYKKVGKKQGARALNQKKLGVQLGRRVVERNVAKGAGGGDEEFVKKLYFCA